MIKTKYILLALWTLCSLGACIAPDNDDDNCQECREQQILLQLASDKATTRAGRPLTSNQPTQDVDRVALLICDDKDNIVTAKLVTDWMSNSTEYDTNNHRGRQDRVKLDEDERLEAGTYKLYAIAYTYKETDTNNRTGYTVGTETTGLNEYFEALVKDHAGKTFTENFTLHLSNTPGEEIFAGSVASFTVTSAGFNVTIVLNRQVAGAFVYVKDIPYMAGASRYLRLVASNQNKKLVLGQFANTDLVENGDANTAAKYVVNGTDATSTVYEICEIDLNNWFKTLVDHNDDGLIDATIDDTPGDGTYPAQGNNWKNPYKESNPSSYPTFRRGSVFGGEFIIPFARTGAQTLRLQLTDASGQELLSWNINLPATDLQITKGKNVTYWGQDATTTEWGWLSFAQAEDKNSYSLVRNHLYGVGNRTMDNPGFTPDPDDPDKEPVDPVDPDDPSDPDPDDPDPTDPDNPNPDPDIDEPESLDNKQVLILQVNDNWEIIHDMELD